MPELVKTILENYPMLNIKGIIPFRKLETGDMCYALRAVGKVDDNVPWKIKRKYRKVVGKDNLLIWKLPKSIRNLGKRVGYAMKEGRPTSDESFYNFVYVFVPEIEPESVAAYLKTEFIDERDHAFEIEAEDLG